MSIAFTKQPGALSLTGSKAVSNPIIFQVAGSNAYVNGSLRQFYRIGLKVIINDVIIATFERPVRAALATDTLPVGYLTANSGIMQIDIAEVLRQRLTGHFSFPYTAATPYFYRSDILKKFKVTIYEIYGVPPVEQAGSVTSNEYNILQGQLGNFAQGQLNYLEKTVYDKIRDGKIFLTNAPRTKYIDIYQPERLYFLFLQNFNGFLCIKHYYADGTTEISKSGITVYTVKAYEFIVDYKQIRISAPKRLVKYEIWLGDSGTFFSEVRTYVMDYKYQSYARYFTFLNSWGVYETIRTIGKADKAEKTDKKFITLVLADNFLQTDRETIQSDSGIVTSTYKINTGYFPNKYWTAWLQEFLISKDVYALKRGQVYPVNISAGKRTVSSDGDFNPFAEFELTHALTEDFSEDFAAQEPIDVGEFPIDFVTDFFIGTVISNDTLFYEPFTEWKGTGNSAIPLVWHWYYGISGTGDWVSDSVHLENDNGRLKTINTSSQSVVFALETPFRFHIDKKYRFTFDCLGDAVGSLGCILRVLDSTDIDTLISGVTSGLSIKYCVAEKEYDNVILYFWPDTGGTITIDSFKIELVPEYIVLQRILIDYQENSYLIILEGESIKQTFKTSHTGKIDQIKISIQNGSDQSYNVGIEELDVEIIITDYKDDPNILYGPQWMVIAIDNWEIQANTEYTLYIRNKPSNGKTPKVYLGDHYSDWTLTHPDNDTDQNSTMAMSLRIIE